MASKVDRNGVTTRYTYDVYCRLLSVAAGSLTTIYTYDGNGNQLTMTDATGTTTRTYDQLNRTTSKMVPNIGQITFLYEGIKVYSNLAGRPINTVEDLASAKKMVQ